MIFSVNSGMKAMAVAIILFISLTATAQQDAEFVVRKPASEAGMHGILVLPRFNPNVKQNEVWIDTLFGFGDTIRLSSNNLSIKSYMIGWRDKDKVSWSREIQGDIVNEHFARLIYNARKSKQPVTLGGFQCMDTAGVKSTFNIKYQLKFR